mgnify:CR=1 FL=1
MEKNIFGLKQTKKTRLDRINNKAEGENMQKSSNMLEFMAKDAYSTWYKQDVAPNITKEQENAVMHRISDLTLEDAIWMDRETNFIEQFPELKPYSHSRSISGLQLVAVMETIFYKQYPEAKF